MPTARDLLRIFDNAADRFCAFGVDLRKGRFLTYRNTLVSIDRAESEHELPDERLIRAVICEIEDLAAIAGLPDKLLGENRCMLRTIVRGHPIYTDEKLDDPGRQAAFPFYLARQFIDAGSSVVMEKPSDLVVSDGRIDAIVECKRVNSRDSLARKILEAHQQISRHRKAGVKGFGIVAVEVSRVANPDFHEYSFESVDRALLGLQLIAERSFRLIGKQMKRYFRQIPLTAEVDAIFYRFQAVARTRNADQSCYSSWRIETSLGARPPRELEQLITRLPGYNPGIVVLGPL